MTGGGRGDQEQMGDGTGDGARAAAESEGVEAIGGRRLKAGGRRHEGEDEQRGQLSATEVIRQGGEVVVVGDAGDGEAGEAGESGAEGHDDDKLL